MTKANNQIKKIINFRLISAFYPTFTNIKAHVTYHARSQDRPNEKTIQSAGTEFELPLNLYLRTTTPSKDAKFKVTLCTDKDPLLVK